MINLVEKRAEMKPASDIYVVKGTSGNDRGFASLTELMGANGLQFYRSRSSGNNKNPRGLIARNDTIVIKVNSQWDQRGGTNTDLLKSLVKALTEHPDGFSGEIVLADNGQAQYGSTGKGGNLDWERNNAEDISQSVQKVAASFSGYKVSTYLWDKITTLKVREYSEGDSNDGYIVIPAVSPETGLMISYPKFKTRFGSHISLKLGIWDPNKRKYDSTHLKFINVPVLKAHFIYGVTGCVKHYMGVVSDKLTAQAGARSHEMVGAGGMGTEMVGTRYPTLNVLDAIWVNAKPAGGPWTPYEAATQSGVIAAGIDPVAIDYWSAKNILMPLAKEKGYDGLPSIDPDNPDNKCFGRWLRLAMEEIKRSGYQATNDESRINVYLAGL
jgi:hypothetical protein